MDDDKLFRLMRAVGWNKSTKPILRNWRTGYSYGPRYNEDITVLGEALGINSFVEDVNFYYNAMSKIRVERRKASRIFLERFAYIFEIKILSFLSLLLKKSTPVS